LNDRVTTDGSTAELRQELERVEREIDELRQHVRELRERIGNRWDDPGDRVDHTSLITMAEEQEAVLATLEARRNALRERLAQHEQHS
jgi:hypothetical protein